MKLKPYEMRLISHCLELASDEFGNHGCNDFDLTDKDLNLTDEQKRELTLNMAIENGDQDEIFEVRNGDTPRYTTDWCVMSYFARMLDGLELPDAAPEPEGAKVARLKRHIDALEKESLDLQCRLAAVKSTMREAVNSL